MKKYVLVTGGAGYIGSHTVVELVDNGFTPVIVDDLRNSDRRVLDGLEKMIGDQFEIHTIDVCDRIALQNVFETYDFSGVIHFAAFKAVDESVNEPLKYYRNNLVGLMNVLELTVEYNVPSFVFSSSCTVYGEPEDTPVVDEQTPVGEQSSPYGRTKHIGELMLQDLAKTGSGPKMLLLRYFNPVGAHPSGNIGELPIGTPGNLFPVVTQTGAGVRKELTVFGNDYHTNDGTCVRDFIHVCDVAEAHVSGLNWLLSQHESTCEVVNLGTGRGTSVLEIIHTFEKQFDTKLNWKFGPRRIGDVPEIYADVNKASELLKWQAKRTIEDAIRDAWNWEQRIRK